MRTYNEIDNDLAKVEKKVKIIETSMPKEYYSHRIWLYAHDTISDTNVNIYVTIIDTINKDLTNEEIFNYFKDNKLVNVSFSTFIKNNSILSTDYSSTLFRITIKDYSTTDYTILTTSIIDKRQTTIKL